MTDKKINKNTKKTLIQYGIFAIVAITLYATGRHTDVIGFAQRGILATGLMNPDVEELSQLRQNENNNETATVSDLAKADLSLKLMDMEGNTTSLAALKGKVIFLNFWATWCPPCVAEMPSIDKLHEEMGDEVAFVMLSLDEDFEKAKAFDKRKGYGLPIYAPASNLPAMYQSSAIPTTYVIDANGNLALTHKGMADYSDPEFKKFLKGLK
ncbi:TlpA family protein disulfide reductase [Arenibacter algicola]|jgi:thiol-disulfide isomerase/thioredoxin|uniref:Thiol-disulfide oxidoreductase ResA n=1 Tax=Arenibacter algicola TaxID=616991 RepID=A0A221URY2_9FLAO|nr:TlpA disulfide reductase family protein [Arenibacter algicola]ASO04094.1 thiol-disulfide oxidoreductase ResA [Arenibacter algicola]|tara:strand:- start:2473 stop:3105 length:633 start_codon:yes stop_codon:yes gene_type:complete